MDSPAIADMLATGMLATVDPDSIDGFVSAPGLKLLFFAGGKTHSRETHDVAVALREKLREYPGQLSAALVENGNSLQQRFRVLTAPSLVFMWADRYRRWCPGFRVLNPCTPCLNAMNAPTTITITILRTKSNWTSQ